MDIFELDTQYPSDSYEDKPPRKRRGVRTYYSDATRKQWERNRRKYLAKHKGE